MTIMYAAVAHFSHELKDGRINGCASPAGGSRPAAVALYAGKTLVHVAQASRYDKQAAALGNRLGWCGFEVPGAAQAFALSSHVTLRCHASGRVLTRLRFNALNTVDGALPRRIGPADLLSLVREETDAATVSQILPFAEFHHRRHGRDEFLDAAYRTLLRRAPDPGAFALWSASPQDKRSIADMLAQLARCDEFKKNPARHIPGPFHPDFLFTRDPLL